MEDINERVLNTQEEIEEFYRQLLQQKSGWERITMSLRMFQLAKELMIARLREEKPKLSAQEIKIELIRRLYGDVPGEIEKNTTGSTKKRY